MTVTKTRTGSSGADVRRLAADAALFAFALGLSYLEAVLPLTAWIPLPGFKLGLANLAVIAAAFLFSDADAAAVSVCRVALAALLFGSPLSLLFSLGGAALSFAVLLLLRYTLGEKISYFGLSVLCAAAHNIGQIAVAATVMASGAVLAYLPMLLLAAAATGSLTGLLLIKLMPRLLALKPKLYPGRMQP